MAFADVDVPFVVVESAGYLAAVFVFMTFYTRTMLPLRYLAIASNLAFIVYAALAHLMPILVLHCALLPLNVIRLRQYKKLIDDVAQASDRDFSIEWLLPYMSTRRMKEGEYLFHLGEHANEIFFIVDGAVLLPEFGLERSAGEMIGEIGIFSPNLQRTSSAKCRTDCQFLTISSEKVLDLYFQNPRFGIYLLRLVTGRLIAEIDRLRLSR